MWRGGVATAGWSPQRCHQGDNQRVGGEPAACVAALLVKVRPGVYRDSFPFKGSISGGKNPAPTQFRFHTTLQSERMQSPVTGQPGRSALSWHFTASQRWQQDCLQSHTCTDAWPRWPDRVVLTHAEIKKLLAGFCPCGRCPPHKSSGNSARRRRC